MRKLVCIAPENAMCPSACNTGADSGPRLMPDGGLTPEGALPTVKTPMQRLRPIPALFATAFLFAVHTAGVSAQEPATSGSYNSEAAALLQQARDWDNAGSVSRAIGDYRTVVKRYPVSPSAPAAQFRIGELYDAAGNTKRAFDAYQKLLENYPQSREFDRAVDAQVAIADALMDSRRYERAAEMYESVLKTAPYAKFAAAVQFKLGQAYENQSEWDKATAAYQGVIDRYPDSSYASDALYQIGYVQFTEANSRSKDLSAAIDAKNTFEEFLMEHPKSEKAAQARENLSQMSGRESLDLLSIAKFYDHNDNYRAAVIYYSDVVRRQPGTPDAELASARIEEIRATVGEDELRQPEREETGTRAAMRRRMQNEVQTSALSNYAGPPVSAVKPPEELAPARPRLRTSADDMRPQRGGGTSEPADMPAPDLPPVEPDLPSLDQGLPSLE
ncbi:MAG: outer membrane protein assembly factor BamD [Chthoniobacterales bacterium]|nr:outer membrane protein assembly factor BamD [Chthoniobacterales bacterium]